MGPADQVLLPVYGGLRRGFLRKFYEAVPSEESGVFTHNNIITIEVCVTANQYQRIQFVRNSGRVKRWK